MSTTAIKTSQPATAEDWLERVRSVVPLLRDNASSIEAARSLTPEVLAAMHGAKLFRMSLPISLGGGELPVPILARATEIIAGADASAGWCLGQGLGCAMSSAFLAPDARAEVFGAKHAVLAWGAGIQGTAVACAGGYRVSGTWRFASGSKHATWLGAHCKVLEADGTPRLDVDGKAANRTALLPRELANVHDDWHVMGLRGTRSEGYTVEDLFVSEHLTLDRETLESCQVGASLYRFPTTNVYASMFSGVALGIARTMLDDLVKLAGGKTGRGRQPLCARVRLFKLAWPRSKRNSVQHKRTSNRRSPKCGLKLIPHPPLPSPSGPHSIGDHLRDQSGNRGCRAGIPARGRHCYL